MICDPCKRAGRYFKEARNGADECVAPSFVEALHAKCEAPTTCPCQHGIGQHVKP
jgi:hypothetical protein